jgi:ABC-type uncharacterized transport system permease subunit
MDLGTLTTVHTALSFAALALGVFAVAATFRSPGGLLTELFLVTAILTSAAGFLFPFSGLLPSHITGIIALVVLALMLLGRFVFRLNGPWRWIYAAGMAATLYLLVFVGIAQTFLKIGPIKALAPTGSEPPFLIAQLIALAIFIWIGIRAARRFRPA